MRGRESRSCAGGGPAETRAGAAPAFCRPREVTRASGTPADSVSGERTPSRTPDRWVAWSDALPARAPGGGSVRCTRGARARNDSRCDSAPPRSWRAAPGGGSVGCTRGARARNASRCDSAPPLSSARTASSSSRTSATDRATRARSRAVRSSGPSPFTVETRVKSRWARKRRGATSGWRYSAEDITSGAGSLPRPEDVWRQPISPRAPARRRESRQSRTRAAPLGSAPSPGRPPTCQ